MAAAMVGLMGIGTAPAVPQGLEMQQRCAGGEAQLGEVWNDPRREQLEKAILGTGVSHAPSTWARVEARIDEYARAWVDKHDEVCEATSVRHEQTSAVMDLRMGCLRAREVALDAVVGVLGEANSSSNSNMIEKAVETVAGLPDIGRCDEVEWLEQQEHRVPPPEEPKVAAQVEELRDELATIEALHEGGQYGTALERVERLLEDATVVGYAPLWAEVELRRGQRLQDGGRYQEADQALLRAHARALARGHVAVVLEAAQVLTFVVGVYRLREAAAIVWAETAVHLAEYVGDEVQRARSQGRVAENGVLRAIDFHCLRVSVAIRGALTRMDTRALRIFEGRYGGEHPVWWYSLVGLARVALEQREFGVARRYAERAELIRSRSEATSELLTGARFVLARALWSSEKRRSEARRLAEQAGAVFARGGAGRGGTLVRWWTGSLRIAWSDSWVD